jgi:hypothetical protein
MTMTQVIGRWLKFGCVPTVARVHNLGCQGCSRWVVLVHYWGLGDSEDYRGEFDTRRQAERSARAINAAITRTVNKLTK